MMMKRASLLAGREEILKAKNMFLFLLLLAITTGSTRSTFDVHASFRTQKISNILATMSSIAIDRLPSSAGQRQHPKKSKQKYQITLETAPAMHLRDDIRKMEKVNPVVSHEVIFAMTQQNTDEVDRLLWAVSDPFSNEYGNHLSRAEVGALTSPSEESRRAVRSFLSTHGVDVVSETNFGEFVVAKGTIATWERILEAQFYHFEYKDASTGTTKRIFRSESYTMPVALRGHVFAIHNTVQTSLHRKRPLMHESAPMAGANVTVLPFTTIETLNRVYDIRSNKASAQATQGLYEALNQSWSPSDLLKFQRIFKLPEQPIGEVIGGHKYFGNCTFGLCGEANLDVQYILATAQDAPTTYYYSDDSFAAWLMALANMTAPPQVLSISYGGPEFYNTVSEKAGFNLEAKKLGLMGVSLFVASGDDGVGNFIVRKKPGLCGYFSDYPSGSPYVTAVGATQGPESGLPEVVCQSDNTPSGVITSGGGFSDHSPRPSWQADVVDAYFRAVQSTPRSPYPGYNPTGRGYPDISAAGLHYHVVIGGKSYHVSGTSGMVTLVNAERLKQGKGTVGWLNPALYAYYKEFTIDVVSGHNRCGADNVVCCRQGFYAAPGWDPATGLGSLNFTKFLGRMTSLANVAPLPSKEAPNTPSVSPTSAPPSLSPTPFPTQAPGYAYITHYADRACHGEVERVEGYATGTCAPNYEQREGDSAPSLHGYVRYTCSEQGVMVNLYSDDSCESLEDDFSYNIVYVPHSVCATVHRHSKYIGDYRNWTTSAVAQCITQPHTKHSLLPVAAGATNQYVVAQDYASTACSDPNLLGDFYATRNNYCHRAFGDSFQSYLVIFPSLYFYQGSYTCEPDYLIGSGDFPPDCDTAESDPFYYFSQGGVVSSSFYLYN